MVTTPRTPRTPLPTRLSSSFNSPASTFRPDDETLVLEFSTRYFRAGIAGEARPRCLTAFGPRRQRRVGDYSQWLPGGEVEAPSPIDTFETWGRGFELWRPDLRGLDLALVGDVIERAVREALVDEILVLDTKRRRIVLTLPTLLPHALLSAVLTTLFGLYPSPSTVMLLPYATTSVVAAGLRSGLTVDIGWHETTATAVYEYREVHQKSSSRAMKLVTWQTRSMLEKELRRSSNSDLISASQPAQRPSFEETEEVVARMLWCQKSLEQRTAAQHDPTDPTIDIPIQSGLTKTNLAIPFSHLGIPTETAFFSTTDQPQKENDDHEMALPFLIYTTLLSLPIDVRQVCLTRIVVSGDGAGIPGLKSRLLAEIANLIQTRGWKPVHNHGSATRPPKREPYAPNTSTQQEMAKDVVSDPVAGTSSTPAHQQQQINDIAILASLRSHTLSTSVPPPISPSPPSSQTQPRCISTLGAWAGASLVAGLRVQGTVEIERDEFLKHGLAGGLRGPRVVKTGGGDAPAPARAKRGALLRRGTGEHAADKGAGGWSLGVWT